MEHIVLQQFKGILETMLADLQRPLRRLDEIAIETTPDALDEVQNAAERELAIRQLEHDSSRFRFVKAALQRIEEGTYGQCVRCEADISSKRLKAVPWTPYCLDCQDIADHNTVEAEPDLIEFTDRRPKVMGAGHSVASEEIQSALLEETGSADFEDRFLRHDFDRARDSAVQPQRRPPAAPRLQRKTKQSM
jgi:DnaK suppressor protein